MYSFAAAAAAAAMPLSLNEVWFVCCNYDLELPPGLLGSV